MSALRYASRSEETPRFVESSLSAWTEPSEKRCRELDVKGAE